MPKRTPKVTSRDPRQMGAQCEICPLKGSPPVLGEGPKNARYAVVGEAPGRDEVKIGRPFIGKSGQLLDAYLEHLGVPRSTVWISNAISCFPPGGDLNEFIQGAKKRVKEAGNEFHHPTDCCRNRLFRELRIPKCRKCSKWVHGPFALICHCKTPQPVLWDGLNPIESVTPAGNAALESLVGVEGIMKWRGSVLDMEKRRKEASNVCDR